MEENSPVETEGQKAGSHRNHNQKGHSGVAMWGKTEEHMKAQKIQPPNLYSYQTRLKIINQPAIFPIKPAPLPVLELCLVPSPLPTLSVPALSSLSLPCLNHPQSLYDPILGHTTVAITRIHTSPPVMGTCSLFLGVIAPTLPCLLLYAIRSSRFCLLFLCILSGGALNTLEDLSVSRLSTLLHQAVLLLLSTS